MEMSKAIALVRRDIGDPAVTFMTDSISDGMTVFYDLPQQKINPVGLTVQYQSGADVVTIPPAIVPGSATIWNTQGVPNYSAWSNTVTYDVGALVIYSSVYYQATATNTGNNPQQSGDWQQVTLYTLDAVNGSLIFTRALPLNAVLVVSGQAFGLFTDDELQTVIEDAERQHCQGQTLTERYRDSQGFITYRDMPKTLDNLPYREENLLVTLADIDAMWILATDAATDVNVQTAEGTNIDRTARYMQYMKHIAALQQKYEMWCGQLGVGMFRTESLNLRRVSRTNNRLVPIFRPREYDDHRYPTRELPQIDRRDEDSSGVPSPIWNGLPL